MSFDLWTRWKCENFAPIQLHSIGHGVHNCKWTGNSSYLLLNHPGSTFNHRKRCVPHGWVLGPLFLQNYNASLFLHTFLHWRGAKVVDTPTTKFQCHNDRSKASPEHLYQAIRAPPTRTTRINKTAAVVISTFFLCTPWSSSRFTEARPWRWCGGVLVVRWILSVFLTLINILGGEILCLPAGTIEESLRGKL